MTKSPMSLDEIILSHLMRAGLVEAWQTDALEVCYRSRETSGNVWLATPDSPYFSGALAALDAGRARLADDYDDLGRGFHGRRLILTENGEDDA